MVRNIEIACRGVNFKNKREKAQAIKRAPILGQLIQNNLLKIDKDTGRAVFPTRKQVTR